MTTTRNSKKNRVGDLCKFCGKAIIIWIVIHLLVVYFFEDITDISNFTKDVFLQGFSTLMGVVIASLGILIGTISGLYTILIDANNKKTFKNISEDLNKLDDTVLELKEDTVFLIVAYFLNLIATYALQLHFKLFTIPYYGELYPYLAKLAILTSFSITLIVLGILITYDIVMTMFTIYKAYIRVTKDMLLN